LEREAILISDNEFACVVRCAPLPSIDLIIMDPDSRVLVGLRTNEPAKDYYFVPGGIIRKRDHCTCFCAHLKSRDGLPSQPW
jgi:hypothetical protein